MGYTRAGSNPAADEFIIFFMGQVLAISQVLCFYKCNIVDVVDEISLYPPFPPFCMFSLFY